MNNKEFTAEKEMRLDMFLSEQLDETRNQIDHLITKGFVSVENKKKAKSGLKLKVGQKVSVELPLMVKEFVAMTLSSSLKSIRYYILYVLNI